MTTFTAEYCGEGVYHFDLNGKKYVFHGMDVKADTYDDKIKTIVPVSGLPEDVAAILSNMTKTANTREPLFKVWADDEADTDDTKTSGTPTVKIAPGKKKPGKNKGDGFDGDTL